jgi:alkaline phosphatase
VWGLFAPDALPYDLDMDRNQIPTIAEMTQKSIEILSKNQKGFFLMVEGSKVDWAAHNNDPVGMVTEFLAFDEAVKHALDFAKKDGNTAVIVCSDHGNSGISIGGPRTRSGYDTLNVLSLTEPLKNCKLTAEGLSTKVAAAVNDQEIINIFKDYTQITVTKEELETLNAAKKSSGLTKAIAKVVGDRTFLGFTTTGHTGEDVFLAVYHPNNYRLSGVVQNSQVNDYMRDISGNINLDELANKFYSPDSLALKGLLWSITPKLDTLNTTQYAKLIVKKTPKSKMRAEIKAYTDYVTIFNNKKAVKTIPLNSVIIYNYIEDKSNKKKLIMQRFYCPLDLGDILNTELK